MGSGVAEGEAVGSEPSADEERVDSSSDAGSEVAVPAVAFSGARPGSSRRRLGSAVEVDPWDEDQSVEVDAYDDVDEEPVKLPTYSLGQQVMHPAFGVGRVESIQGRGGNASVTIHFNVVGRKRLMLAYAKLQQL